jgi:hypothetical protein
MASAPVTHADPQLVVAARELTSRCFFSHDMHFCTGHQSNAATRPLAEAQYHFSRRGENSEGLRGKDAGRTSRFTALPEVGSGATAGTL